MMKKYLRTIICMLAALAIAAPQASAIKKPTKEKPDLEKIRQETLDPQSPYYFPTLRNKYLTNDTLMSPEEYRNYYLGYMFQEDYDPYRESVYAERTDSLLQLNREKNARNDSTLRAMAARKESPYELHHLNDELKSASLKERREIVKLADLALKDNPFDLNTMWLYQLVLKDMNKTMMAKIWDYRLANLLGAIISTGTGLDKENAFYVTSPEHEYAVLEMMGYRPLEYVDTYFPEGYDYITVEPIDPARKNASTPKGFFFNVKKPLEEYARKHPDEIEQ